MKRKNYLFVYFIIMFMIMLTACNAGTEYKRNADYTYGTLEDGGIKSIYELEGTPSQNRVEIPNGVSQSSQGSYFV